MSTFDLLKTKLPASITRNPVLDEFIGMFANSIDLLTETFETGRNALTADGAGTELNALALDLGLERILLEPDRVLSIRIQNGIKTHQERGSIVGIENEGADFAMVSPYVHDMNFVIGVDPIGLGDALGATGYPWIQFWVDVTHTEAAIKQRLTNIMPLHSTPGIDYIDVTGSPTGYASAMGTDFLTGGTFTGLELVGYIPGFHDPEGIVPVVENSIFTYGNLDLGATVADYTWMIDWIDHVRWDVDYTLVMEVSFSSDGATNWTDWNTYEKNDFVDGSDILRYAKFRFTLTMTDYENLNHYFFRKFIVKGLTESQMRFGQTQKHHLIPIEIGN